MSKEMAGPASVKIRRGRVKARVRKVARARGEEWREGERGRWGIVVWMGIFVGGGDDDVMRRVFGCQ